MTLSIAFQTDKPLSAYGPLAQRVEAYGFPLVTVYNDMLFQPAWYPLLEMARHTTTIQLGPTAVNPFTTHPIHIASQIALLDKEANGRAFLGLARGSWLDFVDIVPERPVTAVVEAFACIRHLLRQDSAPCHGEVFSLAGGDVLRWPILRADIPFLLGSWGSQTIARSADYISAVKLGGTTNPQIVAELLPKMPPHVRLAVGAVCVVDENGEAAKQAARREAALYLSVIARLDYTLGIEPPLLDRIMAATAVYDYETVANNISDALLRRIAFAGTPEQVAEQAQLLYDAGVDRIEFGTPHGIDPNNGLRLLGERVKPLLT